jgi:hypothetical protein
MQQQGVVTASRFSLLTDSVQEEKTNAEIMMRIYFHNFFIILHKDSL